MNFLKRTLILLALAAFGIGASSSVHAQSVTPEVTSWIINTSGATGYNGLPTNIQQVQYSADWVYVSASCIPGYDIGPWQSNPNIPVNQNFVFKLTRHPQANGGTAINTPLGHIGVWSNGVSIFNAKDAQSYNNAGVWNQNALAVEGGSFDSCLGHPAPNGEYHHHVNPRCLYDDADSAHHSPIIGYAFDGYPIYGAYAFANTDGTGDIVRMRSSYRMRNISDRTTLANGTALQSNQYGPAISGKYVLGYYLEDFEFVQGLGDLDEHNGRYCVTPEYPQGTYAYFVTIDAQLQPVFPYTIGATYYGTTPSGNIGPGSGHNTITESVTTYTPNAEVTSSQVITVNCNAFPNPTTTSLSFEIAPCEANNFQAVLFDAIGRPVVTESNVQPAVLYTIDVHSFAQGVYYLRLQSGSYKATRQIVIAP